MRHARTLLCAAITATFGVIGCGGNPASPSPVTHPYSGALSGQLTIPSFRPVISMCVFPAIPDPGIHPALTCILQEACVSRSDLQLAVKMMLYENPNGTVIGSADISGSETIALCGAAAVQTLPLSLSYPVTGSATQLAFGATTASIESLQGGVGQSHDLKRTVAWLGALRDGVVSGTLTYGEEFAPRPATTLGTRGSGAAAFATALR